MANQFNMEDMYKAWWSSLTQGGLGPSPSHVALTYTPNLATFATPYTSGDCLGPLTAIPGNAARAPGGGGIIRSVTVVDATQAQRSAFDILLFSDTVTTAADNAAFTISDADALKCVAVIPVLTTDYNTAWAGTPLNSIAYKPDMKTAANPCSFAVSYLCAAQTLYCQLVVRGTPTYTSAADLTIRFGTLQD